MKSFLVKNPIKAPFLFLAFFVLVFAIDFSSPAAAVTQPPATTPSSSISFEKQEELKQLFFETEGTLKPVDTTLHQKGDGFIMDQARYRLQASTQLSNQNPININYQDLNISLIPNNLNPQTKEGRLIQNGSEIDGTDNPKLKDKGIIYDNAYGNGTSLGFIPNPMELQKVLKLTKEAAQQNPNPSFTLTLPKDATFTVGNQNWDKTQPLEVKGKTIHLRYQDTDAYLQPAKVWDSNGNETQITLTLEQNPDGSITLTKHLPEEFLQTATFPIYTDADITFGAESVFNSASSPYTSVSALDSTHVVAVYQDVGNSSYGTAVVGTVSGTDISFGAESVFNSATSSYISVSALDSTHVVAVYRDSGNSNYGTAVVGTVSGTDISFGAESVFNSASSLYTSVSALDSTHVVAVYQDVGNSSYGTAIVGTISGTDISFGAESVFNSASSPYTSVSALDSTHVVAVYQDGGNSDYGTAVVGTVSGTDISFGSEAVFNSAASYYTSVSALDSTHVVAVYRDAGNSDYGTAIVGTVSGTDISFGAESVFNSALSSYTSVSALDSTHVVAVYQDFGNSSYGTAIVGTISGTDISFGAESVFNSGTSSYTSVSALDSTHVVAVYRDDSNSNYGTAVVGTVASNTAPSISAGPSDGGSSSASPTTVGSNVTFTATATDGESDQYYLAICKTNSVTAVNSAAPTCGGGSWAISSATASGSQASVTYATVAGDSESNAWFAFVCDNNASSLCSSSSQGSGTTGSPFEVNHVPTFTSVANTSGYLNTGDTLTFTSVASDSDTSGTADTVTLYICKSNDFTGTACGAGGSWATSSASSSNPSATYTVLSGDTDGTITYYANLIDDSSAEASANPLTGTFQIDNTAPTVSLTGSLTWPAPLTTSFTPTASASDATSGIATYAWSQTAGSGTLTFSSASTLSTSITVDATGTYTVQLTVTDTAGNQTTSSFDLTWSNPSFGGGGNGSGGGFSGGSGGSSCPAPSGTWTFQINQGQPTTQTRAVTLSFTSNPPITPSTLISDTPITVTLANDSAFTNAVSKPYQPELPYTLTKDQGTKTVYAKLQNSCGSFTPTLSAAIDYIPPPFTFKMPFLFTRTLAPGDQGNDVKELQLFLTSLNLFPTTIIANGYYGPTTTGSVRKFQQSNNILQTGTFGPLTRRAANIIQLTRAIRQLEEYLAKLAE